MGRNALGKGLESIFRDKGSPVANPQTGSPVHEIDLSQIEANPFQPRREFSVEELQELSNSIREKGLLQPILLRKHGQGYQIIAGERRFRASQLTGSKTILALVRDKVSDRDMMEIALIENLQRVQLNPIEEALAFDQLISNCGITHEELADRMGKSRSAVTNTLRLLRLDPEVQKLVQSQKLSPGHARNLIQESPDNQRKLAQLIVEKSLNVRDTEKIRSEKKTKSVASPQDPNLNAFIDELRSHLQTKIELKGNSHRGSLIVYFNSQAELENLATKLKASTSY